MPSRRKRLKKKITSLEKQKKKHQEKIKKHQGVKGAAHKIGYWMKENLRFDQQKDESTRILKRKRKLKK